MSGAPDETLREELSALLDGALPAERRRALEERIERDADVRRAYVELRDTVRLVRSLPPLAAPPELRRRLAGARPRGRLLGFSPWWTVAAAAAGVLLAVVLDAADRDGPAPADRTLEAREKVVPPAAAEDAAAPDEGESVRRLETSALAGAKTAEFAEESAEGAADAAEAGKARGASAEELDRVRARDRADAPEAGAGADLEAEGTERRAPPEAGTVPAPDGAVERERAAGGTGAPDEALAGAKTHPVAPGEPQPPWRERVLSGQHPRSSLERARYLRELEQLDGKALARHFERLAQRERRAGRSGSEQPPAPEALHGQVAGPATADGAVALRDRFEAERVHRLLLRLHEGVPRPSRGARQAGGDERDRLSVELELTAGELAAVRAWFDVLEGAAGFRAATPPPTASGIAPAREREDGTRRSVRLVLRWAVPVAEPDDGPRDDR